MMGIGSLLRNRDQALETIRSILVNRLESRQETLRNYWKAVRSLAKRLFSRDPSLTPELKAIVSESGDALNVQGEYVYLNPQCNYLLAHDFADLQFSFQYISGKFYSMFPEKEEIGEYQCSSKGRVRLCREKDVATLNIPVHYGQLKRIQFHDDSIVIVVFFLSGGRSRGALGDPADRAGKKPNPNEWLLRPCPAASRDQPSSPQDKNIVECNSNDDVSEKH